MILEKPTIYDQTATLELVNNLGVNDTLKSCADYLEVLAEKYKLLTVDYFTIMSQLNKKMQAENPSATLIGKDRVHPGAVGHLVMSYQFLKSVQSPKYVSKIVVAVKNKKITTKGSLGSETKLASIQPDEVTFKVQENALPFPTVSNQVDGLELVPFTNDLNVELLQVSGLKKGVYTLSIDGIEIDSFMNNELNKGINLSKCQETPQYIQALKVREILESLWKEEENLRGTKFIECNPFFKKCPDKTNLEVVHSYLDSVFSKNYTNPYYKSQLAKYLKTKPSENEYKIRSDQYRAEAYHMAQPKEHMYRIAVKD